MRPAYDDLERRDPAEREEALLARLPRQVAHAKANAPAYAALLAAVDPAEVRSRRALAELPVVRKSELLALQKARLPFGGLAASGWGAVGRVFSSPGPIYEPEGRQPDYWRLARALHGAGFRAGELVHNAFSYHFSPAGSMLESAAHALGCTVFPAGTGQTEMQVQAIADLRPDGYVGTPSFLKILLDKAAELGANVASLRKALVSGEAFPPSLRDAVAERGVDAYQAYATADLGSIAYETEARAGLVVDEGVLVEIVRPGTGDPLPSGEVGEVVVTSLFNADYPLIRFATGDLSAVLPGLSPCGRTNMRIKGWMGRADQTTKVKGLFVHPSQIAEVLKRHPEVLRARLVVDSLDGADTMTLRCEVVGAVGSESRAGHGSGTGDAGRAATPGSAAPAGGVLADALRASLREVTKMRGEVVMVGPGALPNDGMVIEDLRSYR